eukprot:3937591-Prymnesium_polylepis.1
MGCAGSSQKKTPIQQFLDSIQVKPWGVLGESIGDTPWTSKRVAAAPDSQIVIVDPASEAITFDSGFRPGDAGGAAGAIYRFLGIDRDESFPADVVSRLSSTGSAVYKRYGYPHAYHVIHVVGWNRHLNGTCRARRLQP